jgi:hypothetical protein
VGRLLSILLVVSALAAICAEAPVAEASSPDSVATHRYLLAKLAFRKGGEHEAAASLGVLHELAGAVTRECPNILSGTPLGSIEGDTSGPGEAADLKLGEELTGAVWGAAEPLGHPLDVRFYATVKHLRWSNRKLTKLIHELALEEVRQSAIAPPDLCGDLRFWVASGYLKVSAGTERYDRETEAASSTATIETHAGEPSFASADAVVAHRLKRYEAPADRRLARRAFPPERGLGDPAFRPYLEAIEAVYRALGRKVG